MRHRCLEMEEARLLDLCGAPSVMVAWSSKLWRHCRIAYRVGAPDPIQNLSDDEPDNSQDLRDGQD